MKKTVNRPGVRLYTESFGNASNPPVLLIAGAMAPALWWNDRFCRSLADEEYYVLRFDNRDIGRSTHFPQNAPGITEALWKGLMGNPMYQDFRRGAPEFLKVWRYLHGSVELDEHAADDYTKALYETETIGPAWNHTNIQQGIRDILTELEKLEIPILFIHGNEDYLAADPENVRRLAEYLPNAECCMLPGVGHMFFNDELWDTIQERVTGNFNKVG